MSNSNAPATLAVGDVTETMLVGKIAKVVIREITTTTTGIEYDVEYLGERMCLDFGQNWYADTGYRFKTRDMNITCAAEWRAKGY